MKKRLTFITILMLFCSTMFGQSHWEMTEQEKDKYQNSQTICISVLIDGVPQNVENLEIAAFHNNELRGVGVTTLFTPKQTYVATIKIYGTTPSEEISLKLYDSRSEKELSSDYKFDWNPDENGTPLNPISVNFYEKHWDSNENYQNTMSIACTIKINGEIQKRTDLELAAFCGNDLRGATRVEKLEGGDLYIAILYIGGTDGETINFKLYDPTIDMELTTDYAVPFQTNATMGDDEEIIMEFNAPVAQLGTEKFMTLAEAVAVAQPNETIELINNAKGNGIVINKVRVPFGVICAIYESRPNVSVDIACLSLKTGNACVLRGGKEALNTNKVLVKVMKQAIKDIIDDNVITLIEDTNRELVLELIQCKQYIDLVVPRGGKKLIEHVVSNAKVPFIETGAGNCHAYVDEEVDMKMALDVIINAKVSRPSVCNAIETILVNTNIKDKFLPLLQNELQKYNVEIRGCTQTKQIINVIDATEDDYYQEYNDYIVAIKIVNNVNEAIDHINKYGTRHSDCILSNNVNNIELFLNEIDSACVYANASTRFSDGGEFGFGAELGISTQKLHARGPMGLTEMTTYKYKIYGSGQVR